MARLLSYTPHEKRGNLICEVVRCFIKGGTGSRALQGAMKGRGVGGVWGVVRDVV